MSQSPEYQNHTADWMDGTSRYAFVHRPQRSHKARSKIQSSTASAELSLEDLTDHDDFAFLASMRAHRLKNFIYNNNDVSKESRERLDTLSDFTNTLNKEQTLNLAVWEIIDREIKEWQNVCGSGRPSWSTDTRRSRVHHACASHTEDPLMQSGDTKCLVPFEEPRSASRRSRALSESSIPNSTKLNDLAYLIAIQLLSACFTLPPEQIPETTPSAYHYYNTHAKALSDPKLISALRMHTHFRYTPSFGHQARNNSIANLWDNIYNGRCTPDLVTAIKMMPLGHHYEESRPRKAKRRVRRVLNTTEVSSVDQGGPLYAHDGSIDPSEIPLSSTATAWNRRKGLQDSDGQELTLPPQEPKRINISLPPSPNPESTSQSPLASKSIYTHRHRSRERNKSGRSGHRSKRDRDQRSGNMDEQQSPKDQISGSSSRALESQVRSEPHPVYVQPVKELVVKRWRTFRSRFTQGGSSPDPNSTSNDFMVESARSGDSSPNNARYIGNLRLKSPPGMLTPGSTNSDGKERRRRARKDSEIHSGSSNETPRFNTPMSESGGMTDGLVAAMDVGRASPTIHLIDPLAPSPSSETSTFSTPSLSSYDSHRSSSVAVPGPSHQASPNPRSQSLPLYSPKGGPPPMSRTRKKRKSMLSEMHTPDMYDSPAIEMSQLTARPPLSAAGSAIASPSSNATDNFANFDSSPAPTPGTQHATVPFYDVTPGFGTTPFNESPFVETPGSVFVDWGAGNVREQAVEKLMENELAMERARVMEQERERMLRQSVPGPRPRMVRMSTSGTQRFTPNEDGVEIDGLPVGPGLEEAGWNVEQKGKGKLRESSFL